MTGRLDLWHLLPQYNREADTTGDLAGFIGCLQDVADTLLRDIDKFPEISDIERAPEGFIDLILADLGNPFRFDLVLVGKRRLANILMEIYRQKGTGLGIKNAIRFFLGIEITAIRPLTETGLILGEPELGHDWELGPAGGFALYALEIEVDRVLTDSERQQIRTIVGYMKPAHTHFVFLIEPTSPNQFDHWELGISELNDTTYLHE